MCAAGSAAPEQLPVRLRGAVTHGHQLGRSFDMPTANIVPDIDISGLPLGVYYSSVTVEGRTFRGITNLGTRPTVSEDRAVNAETFLYDFDGDLYGKELQVDLLAFRRPEQKFESLEALKAQMHLDLEAGRTFEQKK